MRNFIGLFAAGVFGWLASGSIPFWVVIVLAPLIFLFARWLATLALGAFLYSQLSDEQKRGMWPLETSTEFTNTRRPVSSLVSDMPIQQANGIDKPRLNAATQAAMAQHDITFEAGQYVFRSYRYDKLNDALSYARLVAQRELG